MTGNDDSFRRLISDHSAIINKVCYMYADSVEDFDDMRQEAFINLWNGYASFRGEAVLSTWVYRVTLNSCVSYFRKYHRNGHMTPLDTIYDLPSSDIDLDCRMNEMHALINKLGRVEKALILLWLDEYPYDTIADIMGLPRNTVASRLHRIKEKLVRYSNQ